MHGIEDVRSAREMPLNYTLKSDKKIYTLDDSPFVLH